MQEQKAGLSKSQLVAMEMRQFVLHGPSKTCNLNKYTYFPSLLYYYRIP